jgi:EmrB/QacA subfamily drug resistance transporter
MTLVAHPRWVVALACSAQFMVVLDLTMVNVALPSLRDELGLSAPSLHWVVSAYAVAFGGFLLVGGRAADALGRRRALVVGAALFIAASLGCGLATSGGVLVAARALQGVGAALLSPSAFGLLVASFAEGRARTHAIATWGSIGSLGAVAGLAGGGVLTELLGWRAVFLVNIPLGLALVAPAAFVLPPSRPERRMPVDLAGATLATAGVAGLVYLLTSGSSLGWTSGPTLCSAAAAVGALALFTLRERQASHPLLPASLLRDLRFVGAGFVGLLHGAAMLGMLLLLVVYLQAGRGLSPLQTGTALLLLRAPAVGWARVVGGLIHRFGPQPFLVLGSALMTCGLLSLARLPVDGPLVTTLAPSLVILGLAIPCLFVSVNAAALGGVDPDQAALGSGTLSTFQWVGGALGLALVAAVADDPDSGVAAPADAIVESVHDGFLACGLLGVVALAVAVAVATRMRATGRPAAGLPAVCRSPAVVLRGRCSLPMSTQAGPGPGKGAGG